MSVDNDSTADVRTCSTIEEHLKALFSLNTLDQVEPVAVPTTAGYSSKQSKYTINLNDGTKKHVFIKHVDKEATDPETKYHRMQLENEVAMYKTFLPEISKFVDEHDELSTDTISSCFVEFYGNFETDKVHCLVLEDFESRENKCGLKFQDNLSFEDREAIFKKLGMLYGTCYAWKELKHPGASADQISKLYPDFERTEPLNDGLAACIHNLLLTGFIPGLGLVMPMVKMITSLMESDSHAVPKVKSRCNLEALNRLVNMMPGFISLYRHLQRPIDGVWGPIFGDASLENIAHSKSSDEIVFFDFGLSQLSTVMADFQRFTGSQRQLDPHIDQHLETFIGSFVETTALFGVTVSSDQLMAEYHRTKPMWVITRYFRSCVIIPQSRDRLTGLNEEKELVERVKKADITTAAGRAEVVEALDKIDYGPISGWLMVNEVVELVNSVEDELTKFEELIENTEFEPNACFQM